MKKTNDSWYARWFSGSNSIKTLVTILLVLLIIFLFWQVRFIFGPVNALFGAVGAPIIVAGVFYYLLSPVVAWLEKHTKLKRNLAAGLVLAMLLVIVVAVALVLVNLIRTQVTSMIHNWPTYWSRTQSFINNSFSAKDYDNIRQLLSSTNDSLNQSVLEWGKKNISTGVSGISSLASTVTGLGVTLISSFFMLYYMLLDGHKLPNFIADKMPTQSQKSTRQLLSDMSQQIAKYIRGQLGVALAVVIMFSIGYTIIGLPYGILLAILAGVLNLIPYIGSILAQVPVFAVALLTGGPKLLVLVIIVLCVEQPLEGHVITPKILGDALSIHPVTVIVVLLSAGHIFGVAGIILAVPGYAVLKVLVTRLYQWWRQNSDLFEKEEKVAQKND
ncbi:Predicted PurR-regulated permease PerM (PerM) [Eupransor demetentiae]|uniref:Predicted PurR-regulated permease PerM (PerM) n=1 Tax=Eupransor demetentiae TaxID=3109584 RepID=A0ABP0EPA6_9LACO|nr:Predicted PurR-regulated permease PerM (PerM) [Lactobacillaceae bacterium LMG 33000]